MENDFQVASISEDCVSEINELQNKLNKETDKDIVLIAYQSKTDDWHCCVRRGLCPFWS